MELVDDVIALQSQVKTLESQVKALQQAQKAASTAKPIPLAPVIDVAALKQQLRSEFVTQINQLRTELDQLKSSQAQAAVATNQKAKFGPVPAYMWLGIVGSALLMIWSLWHKSATPSSAPVAASTVIEHRPPASTNNRESHHQSRPVKKPSRNSKQETISERQLQQVQRDNARLTAKAKALGIEVPD